MKAPFYRQEQAKCFLIARNGKFFQLLDSSFFTSLFTFNRGRMFNLEDYFKDRSLNEDKLSILVESQGYKIFYLSVPGDKALSAWEKFRDSAEKTGFWPVIMG